MFDECTFSAHPQVFLQLNVQAHAAICWRLTRVPVEDLAGVGEQLEHFELAAVGGHHYVAVVLTQEFHVQHLVTVAHKLWEITQIRQVAQTFMTCGTKLSHVKGEARISFDY